MKLFGLKYLHYFGISILIGISIITNISAQTGLPSLEHPRIFLNDQVIQTLKSRMNANTREWQMFQQYLDTYMLEDPWGDEYLDGISTFALAFLLTDNSAYADRAIYFMEKWVAELDTTKPFYVNGDNYAHIYENVGLGFDWLYNYSGFTSQKKDTIISTMNKVYIYGQKPWEQGGGDFEVDPHDSDQLIGGSKTALFWGIATYGDNILADTMINRSREIWTQNILNWILKSIGGVWPEGSQYSYNTLYFLMALTEAERTANGKNIWTENPEIAEFPKNVITSLIWLTPPSNDHIITYNDQEDDNATYWARRNHCIAITTFIDDNLGFYDEAAYGRYWIRELSPDNLEMNIWKLFLWYDRSGEHKNYFTDNLPLAHFSPGTDWMFLRSDWTKQATYSTFCASWTNVDHQFMDGGNFNIFRNGEYLTRPVRHYDFTFLIDGKFQTLDGEASNIMLIESDYVDDNAINAMGSPEFFESVGEATILKQRTNDSPLFAYSFADLGQSYNRIYDEWGGNSQRVKSYTRQFVQISPDVYFVYDRVRTVDTGWTKYIIHSLTEPNVNGNLITQTSVSGNQYLYNKTLFPKTVTITKINEADVWNSANGLTEDWMIPLSERKWHSIIQPENSDSINMLNVIETTGRAISHIDAAHSIESGELLGAIINNWVVMFSKKERELKKASYQITGNSNTIKNLVCDLEPNYDYAIGLNGNNVLEVAAGKDGTVYFEINNLNGTGDITIEQRTVGVENDMGKFIFELEQNYPNPFNPITTISYSIPKITHPSRFAPSPLERGLRGVLVKLKVYDILGREVATLVNKQQSPGKYSVQFNAKGLNTGIYIYTIKVGSFISTKKMLLIK